METDSKQIEEKLQRLSGLERSSLHHPPGKLADSLNSRIRGWFNYYDIRGVSYAAMSKRRIRYYLSLSTHRYFNRKSQRKSRLYGQQAFTKLVNKYVTQ